MSVFLLPDMPGLTAICFFNMAAFSIPPALADKNFWKPQLYKLHLVESLNDFQKWLSGVSGACLAAVIAAWIAGYTTMQPNCTSTLFSYDVITGTARTAKFFFLSICSSLFSAFIYHTVITSYKAYKIFKSEGLEEKIPNDIPAGLAEITVNFQVILLCISIVCFIVGSANVYTVLNTRSIGGAQLFWKEIENACTAMQLHP